MMRSRDFLRGTPLNETDELALPGTDLRQEWERRRGRFHEDVRPARSPFKRAVWVTGGFVSLGLGIIGALLPIMPTTPFVIVAAACFARSSARFYNKVMSHRLFGPLIYEWRERRTIPRRAKALAIALIITTFTLSIVLFVPTDVGKVVMAAVGASVVVWLLRVPSG
jgi:uncharacterized protein